MNTDIINDHTYEALLELDLDDEYAIEVISLMEGDNIDFQAGDYRYIAKNHINEILTNELESDLYMLGCFTAHFISDTTGLPLEMIKACQTSEAFEAIGRGIVATCGVKQLTKRYAQVDGYGNHFATYDGEEHEIGEYYVFRVN